jgi:hypothetical protein
MIGGRHDHLSDGVRIDRGLRDCLDFRFYRCNHSEGSMNPVGRAAETITRIPHERTVNEFRRFKRLHRKAA